MLGSSQTPVQFSSVAHSCLTLWGPIDCSVPGVPVHHQLLEVAETQAYQVSDAIQPSHTLSSPSPSAFKLSQHQGLFQRVSSLLQVAKVSEFQLKHQSFQWIFRTDLLQDGLVGSPCSPRDSEESSPTPQFKSIHSSVLSSSIVQLSHPYMTTGKTTRAHKSTRVQRTFLTLLKSNKQQSSLIGCCFWKHTSWLQLELLRPPVWANQYFPAAVMRAFSRVWLFATPRTSPPGSSVHGVLQARILERVAISSSRESSWPRDHIRVFCVSRVGRRILYHCTT